MCRMVRKEIQQMSLQTIADSDVVALQEAEKSYGDSWRKRG